jgi:hypothetical protein
MKALYICGIRDSSEGYRLLWPIKTDHNREIVEYLVNADDYRGLSFPTNEAQGLFRFHQLVKPYKFIHYKLPCDKRQESSYSFTLVFDAKTRLTTNPFSMLRKLADAYLNKPEEFEQIANEHIRSVTTEATYFPDYTSVSGQGFLFADTAEEAYAHMRNIGESVWRYQDNWIYPRESQANPSLIPEITPAYLLKIPVQLLTKLQQVQVEQTSYKPSDSIWLKRELNSQADILLKYTNKKTLQPRVSVNSEYATINHEQAAPPPIPLRYIIGSISLLTLVIGCWIVFFRNTNQNPSTPAPLPTDVEKVEKTNNAADATVSPKIDTTASETSLGQPNINTNTDSSTQTSGNNPQPTRYDQQNSAPKKHSSTLNQAGTSGQIPVKGQNKLDQEDNVENENDKKKYK